MEMKLCLMRMRLSGKAVFRGAGNVKDGERAEIPRDHKAPVFEKKPAIRQDEDEDKLFFECIISANPTPTISWFRDDKPVESKDRFQIKCDKKGNSYHCALVIEDVDEEDGGKYKVTAKNNLGESSATINLNFDTEEEEEEEGKPVFTGKPLIKQSPDFKSIIFECNLTADPKPTLQWFHNGKPVNDGGRYKYILKQVASGFLASLEIAQVGSEDGGEYKVTAKNSVGEGSATINLNFEGDASKKIPGGKAPRFPKKPAIKQEGDSLCLEVVLEAHPFPKILWFLGTKEVKEGPRHKIKKKETAKDTYILTLEIIDPSPEDGGTYRCNAVNELGESNANIALNLQGAEEGPTFTQKPKIIPKENGKLILMECHVKSKSALKVTWYQGSKAVQETIRFKSSVVELRGNEYKVALEIRDPSSKDGGIYKCNIKNDEGEINANLNLNIEGDRIEGDAPTFVEKPKIISEDEGKRIIMECKVKANPKPTITWFLDNVVIKETNRIVQTVKQEKDVYTIRLELKSPELTDAGLYKCNVKNVAGESNANLTLNIELAPVIREKPKVLRREKEEKVVIECHVRSNAQPECVWYKENTMVRQDAKHKVQIRKVDKGEYAVMLEIDKPAQSDKGLYKLQAKNEKGIIASEPIKVTLEDEKKEESEEEESEEEEVEQKKQLQKKDEKKTVEKKDEKKETMKKTLQKKEEQTMSKRTIEKKEEQQEVRKTLEKKEEAIKKTTEKKEEQTLAKKTLEKKEEQTALKKTVEKKEDQTAVKKTLEKKEEQTMAKKTLDKKEEQTLTKKTLDKKEEQKETVGLRKTLDTKEEKKEIAQKTAEKKEEAIKKVTETKTEAAKKDVTASKLDTQKKEETKTTDRFGVTKKDTTVEQKEVSKTGISKVEPKKPEDAKAVPDQKEPEKKSLFGKKEPEQKEAPKSLFGKKEAPKEEEAKAPVKKTFRRPAPEAEPPKDELGKIVLK
ncbi:hypothetical protein TNCV_283081 [Trichonephila clavipes]|nr:hypothetical protein TNCV_283081 [Trichonephila clavipes]